MRLINTLTQGQVRRHEDRHNSSVLLGSHGMDDLCPDIMCWRATIESFDRIHLLGSPALTKHTHGRTGLVKDFTFDNLDDREMETMWHFANNGWDLRTTNAREPILVGTSVGRTDFMAIDGNHRLMHQQNVVETLIGTKVILCCHPNIKDWVYWPRKLR